MKLKFTEEDDNLLSALDQNLKELLTEQDLSKIVAWLKKNMKQTVKNPKRKQIFTKLLNNLDDRLEKFLTQYKGHIQNTEVQFSSQKESIKSLEGELILLMKIYIELMEIPKVAELFNSIERVIEILPLANDLKLLQKTMDFISLYTKSFNILDWLPEQEKALPRMIHNVSMIGLHINLYNPKPLSLIELLTDDVKFKEYNTRQEGKLNEIKYGDSLNFEYYIPNLQGILQGEQTSQELNDNGNICVYVESLKAQYPDDSHYGICKKLIKEKGLNIEEDSPIFDALLFRIRLAQDFEQFEKRVEIINTVLKAFPALYSIRMQLPDAHVAKAYIYQNKSILSTLNEVSELLNIQATPRTHKNVIQTASNIYTSDDGTLDALTFLNSKFEHTGEFNLALKDLTSLELKINDKAADEAEKVSLDLRSLILPKGSVLKSSILNKMLTLIAHYYLDKNRKNQGQVDALSHLIPSIMSILQLPQAAPNHLLYSKKIICSALRLVRLLIFNRNFMREFKIMETVLEFGEALFKMVIEEKKCFYQNNSQWEVFSKDDLLKLISETIRPFSEYLLPTGRYLARAEMAPTITRKLAESGLMKCAVIYLQTNKEVDESLFEEILRATSEICRESQTLVPRLTESGLIEELFKKIKDTFHLCKNIGEVLALFSNVCLQAAGREIEKKYNILNLFFEAFTNEKYNSLFEKWVKPGSKVDRYQVGELEKIQSEINYICEYMPEYSGLVSQELHKIAYFLGDQGQFKIKELGEIAAKNLPEEEQKKVYEDKKQDFFYYICKLYSITEIYGRYLYERRRRGVKCKESDLFNYIRLFSTYKLFSSDFHLPQGKAIAYIEDLLKKEMNNSPVLEKIGMEEIGHIEKITGPLNKLKDFSQFLNEEIIEALEQKETLHALFIAKEGSEHIFQFMRSLVQLVFVLDLLLIYRLVSVDFTDRVLTLYMAYLNTSVKHKLFIASNIFKEGADEKGKEFERLQAVIIEGDLDVLGKHRQFMIKMKKFLDDCLYMEIKAMKKTLTSRFPEVILQILSEFKQFKEAPNNFQEKVIWVLKMFVVFETLDRATTFTNPTNLKVSSTTLPAFAFVLYEEGAFEVLAEKVYAAVKFSKESLDQALLEGPEDRNKQITLHNSISACLGSTLSVFEKFFLGLDFNGPTIFKGKKIEGIELQEYANCIWLNHIKLILPFFDLLGDTIKKTNVEKEHSEEVKEAENKKDEIKSGSKEENEADKKENGKKALDTVIAKLNETKLKDFMNMLFLAFARNLSTKQTSVAAVSSKEAKKIDKAAEKVINDLMEMGYHEKVAELATRNIQFLNIGLAIDWISSHPREVEKAENEGKEGSKAGEKGQEKGDELSLGAIRLDRITQEDYIKHISETLAEFNDKFLSFLFTADSSEKGIIKFMKKMIEFHSKNNTKSGYGQRMAVIVMKLFKRNVNNYIKNTKFISSFKIPKSIEKDFGKDIVKQYIEANNSPLAKLQSLERSLFWFIKLKSLMPHFQKNFLKSNFLNELMSFYEHVLENIKELNLILDKFNSETYKTLDCLRRINQSMMKVFCMIYSGKQRQEPESSERKTDKSLSEELERKSATLKEGKTSDKIVFKTKKSPLEALITIISLTNTINNNNNNNQGFTMDETEAIEDLIELLLGLLNENQDNKRQFLKQNGLNELLKLRSETSNDNQFLNEIVILFVNLIEEPNLVLASLEGKVKTYLSQKALQTPDIPLADFTNYFKNLSSRHRKLMVEVIQKVCVVYAKEPDPVKHKSKKKKAEKEKKEKEEKEVKFRSRSRSPKKKESKTTALLAGSKQPEASEGLAKRFIKLKDSADVGKVECLRKSEKKKKTSVEEEVDLAEINQNLPFKPSENISQVLNILIENIVQNFNTTVTKLASEKTNPSLVKEIFHYRTLLKVLALLCTEHPLLLPYVLNYNCSKLLADINETQLPLLTKYKERTHFSFLSYYLRVINCFALDKLRYFLVAISSNRDTMVQNAEGDAVYLGEEITRELINEFKDILQSEVSRPDFLDSPESIQTICSLGSLLLPLLQVKQTLKIVLEKDNQTNKDPKLLLLYIDALNKLKMKNYYKFENVLPFIIDPISVLLQYYNYVIFQQPDLSLNVKYMPKGILIKYNFAETWKLISTDQTIDSAQVPGNANPYLIGGRGRSQMPDLGMDPNEANTMFDALGLNPSNRFYSFLNNNLIGRGQGNFADFQEINELNEPNVMNLRGFGSTWHREPEDGEEEFSDDEEVMNFNQPEEEVENEEDDDDEEDVIEEDGGGPGEYRISNEILSNFMLSNGGHLPDLTSLEGLASYARMLYSEPGRVTQARTTQEDPLSVNVEDDDEEYSKKLDLKDILDSKTVSGKEYPYTTKIDSILKEDIIQTEDLQSINKNFRHLFHKLKDSSAFTLSTNNPVHYESVKKDQEKNTNLYMKIYSKLLDSSAFSGARSHPQGDNSYQYYLREGEAGRGRAFDTTLRRQLGEVPPIASGSGVGVDYNTFERGYLRENQIDQSNATELNNFMNEILIYVEQDVPKPEVTEEENVEESEEEEGDGENDEKTAEKEENTTASNFISSLMDAFKKATLNAGANQDTTNANAEAPSNDQQSQSSPNLDQAISQSPRLSEQASGSPRLDERPSGQSEVSHVEEEKVDAPEESANVEGGSTFKLSDYGVDETFLQNCGIDMTVFDFLPDEEKVELVLQLLESNDFFTGGNVGQATSNTNANQPSGSQAQNQNLSSNQPPEESKEQNPPSGEAGTNVNANNLGSPLQPLNPDAGEQAQAQGQPAANEENANENANANVNTNAQSQQQGGEPRPAFQIPDIDPEILGNLDSFPEDLRNDILQQQALTLQQGLLSGEAPAGGPGDMDTATFLETLDPTLRQEIFITADQNFIDSLPSHLAAEAEIVRTNRLNAFEEIRAQRNDSIGPPPLDFIEKTIKKEKKEQALNLEIREKLFESDEKLIESILKLLYIEPAQFSKFPYELLFSLAQHPKNEFRIFDTLMFLLKNSSLKDIKEGTQEGQEESEVFPPRVLHEKNRMIKDKEVIYEQVSPHILYILQCLTQTRSDYFVKNREETDNLDVAPTLQRNTSLDSIRNLRAEMEIRETHPLYDLLQLCSSKTLIKNPTNVTLLTNIIENICKNPNIFKTIVDNEEQPEPADDKEKEKPKEEEEEEEKKEATSKKKKESEKEEKEEIYLCKYRLDEQSVMSFCQLLYTENLNNVVISKLSFIIGVFCQEKHNLDLFIKVMKEILYKVSLESNKFLQEKLLIFKAISGQPMEQDEQTLNKLKSLLNEVVSKFKNQLLIRRIAKIIQFLYENTVKYLKVKQKYDLLKAGKNKGKEKAEEAPQRKGSLKDELFVKAREEIIKSLETIMLDDNLKTFWINVSECVHVINEKLSNSWDVQNLLNANVKPIIESFFIIHKILNDEEYTEYSKAANKPKASVSTVVANDEDIDLLELEKAPVLGRGFSEVRATKLDPNEMFNFICEKNKKVINSMIKQDLTLLNDSMSMITKKVPKILDFEIRRAYFEKELSSMRRPGSIKLRIKRDRLMENSFNQLYSRNADELRRKLHIEFVGEEGMDAGGVAREWFLELSKQVFNANYNLFIPSANGNTFQPSLISDPANLNYFKFIGKFIAKALFDKQLLECYFTRSFYKHILGQPINYHDIEDVDPDYYKSLKWILENDITNAGLDLTFSYEFDKFGLIIVEDLIPNGRNILVTEENKSKYVHLICNHKMARGIKAQIENFLVGFFELIPKNLIAVFDSKELELLISGLPDIDIVDLKENTEYHGYNPSSQVIKWFWEVMEELDQTQKANCLQFVTGTSKVPLEGFKALKGISGPQRFQIHRVENANALPTGHTCFNQLDLPEYTSKEQLIEKLLLAITEGKEGFGFA